MADFATTAQAVTCNTSIFDAFPIFAQHGYALLADEAGSVVGIITPSDLTEVYLLLAEPFLLLEEIEKLVRVLVGKGEFTVEELRKCCHPESRCAKVNRVDDMTFGEYVSLFEHVPYWERLQLPLDRVVFCDTLREACSVRNAVMHFRPGGIRPSELKTLQRVLKFLKKLRGMGVF